jgi:hypothetical protein
MGRRYRGWEPPEDLQAHAGTDIRHDADFFAPPPEEIGEITSASTTLTRSKAPMSPAIRAVAIAGSAFAGLVIGVGIDLVASVRSPIWMAVWPLVLAAAGGLTAWALTGFSHTCTYVGREGVARYDCKGSRDQVTETDLFEFRRATELRTTTVRRYTNGVYQGTDYTYTWTDVGGRKVQTITGTYSSEAGTPPPLDLFHYASAAEMAWSVYLLDDAQRQLTTKGEVRFRLDGDNWVAIGKDYLRLRLGGQKIERDTQDIASVSVKQGVFIVKEVGAKEGWFRSKGVFKFDYSNLANAQLFMLLLDKVAGLPIE